ncbi:TadE family type IV pilus minor pilin [Kocuria palustris]|uniref:TadE family type IV pilus minor pilin n=1 Tax=Kocuria palustris TaxID=71999 RepID=UPI0021B258C4|nr:TadE family type IV pilus minor pilin [Kocuria palustris]
MTVETAVVLPSIVLLLAVLLACGGAAMLQVRCEEAAGAAARVMARGESAADAQQEARTIAGDAADVRVDRDPDRATARVTMPAPGILGKWESLEVTAEATTFSEEVIVDGG